MRFPALCLLFIFSLTSVANAADNDQQAIDAAAAYFQAKESGDYAGAYAMHSPQFKKALPFELFQKLTREFNLAAGGIKKRDMYLVTWTENPPGALPGHYAAIDFIGSFKNIDKYCGYIILQQMPKGEMLVIRAEENFVTKEHEQQITAQSPQKLQEVWEQLSRKYCPNYHRSPIKS